MITVRDLACLNPYRQEIHDDSSPFQIGRDRYVNFVWEYRHFIDLHDRPYRSFSEGNHEFRRLERYLNVYKEVFELEKPDGSAIKNPPPPTLQIWFGQMPLGLGRRSLEGKAAFEGGATLLYTFAGDGTTAVILYPAKGDLGSTSEAYILLRAGRFSGMRLLDGMKRDLKDLVAYENYSSIDGHPDLCQRVRVWWIMARQIKFFGYRPEPSNLGRGVSDLAFEGMKSAIIDGVKTALVAAGATVLTWLAT